MSFKAVPKLRWSSDMISKKSHGWRSITRIRWSSSSPTRRQWSTPLAKNLAEAIAVSLEPALELIPPLKLLVRLRDRFQLRLTCANASHLLMVAITLKAKINLGRKGTSSHLQRYLRSLGNFLEYGWLQNGWRKEGEAAAWS